MPMVNTSSNNKQYTALAHSVPLIVQTIDLEPNNVVSEHVNFQEYIFFSALWSNAFPLVIRLQSFAGDADLYVGIDYIPSVELYNISSVLIDISFVDSVS